ERARGVFQECFVFLHEGTIGSPKSLVNLLRIAHEQESPLLIVAGDYDPKALSTLVANKIQNGIQVAAIRTGAWGSRRRELLKDIAILTGAVPFTDDVGRKVESVRLEDLGKARTVVVERKTTTISEGDGNPEDIKARVAGIRQAVEQTKDKDEKAAFEARLAGLAGGIAILRIGADTETAMREKKDRADDAMHAVKCALASGVVPGGGCALLNAATACDIDHAIGPSLR